ncbi:MAG: endonuclease/exonuclease/phosphatase family protein [Gemmatimonadota bacterium]
MKTIVLLWVFVVAACAAGAGGPRAVRVLSYNIHAGKDAQQQPNIPRVAALIDWLDADIVMLQEVDRRTTRAGGADHLAELEQLTGMHAAFGKSLDYQGGDYGIALLARWPIDSAVVVPLDVDPPQERSGGSHEPRVGLHAIVRAPFGPLHVLNTHIDASGRGTFRRQEVIALLARIKRAVPADAALVFGGDLNARPATNEITAISLALMDAFAVCGTGAGETFPAARPDRRIDYVFYRRARCLHARVPGSEASDHRPLLVTLEILREP